MEIGGTMLFKHEDLAKLTCPYLDDKCITKSCMMYVTANEDMGACSVAGMSGAVLHNEIKRIAKLKTEIKEEKENEQNS